VIDGIQRRNTVVESEKTYLYPSNTRILNLSTIPDQIRIEACVQNDLKFSPRVKMPAIAKHQTVYGAEPPSPKPKKVEDVNTILTRVACANCCMGP
jgi:hypothetical protein